MKMFVLYVVIPLKIFSCQHCSDLIQEKIDNVTHKLIHAECCEGLNAYDIYFLFGQLEGYVTAIRIIENNHILD